MNIVQWEPRVTAQYVTPDIASDVALHFTGVLCCPVCKHEHQTKTGGHLIWLELGPLSDNVGYEIEELAKKRACSECGIVSTVPAAERSKLKRDAARLVTLSWVEEQIEMLKKSARKTA